jgi:hypothetical protein
MPELISNNCNKKVIVNASEQLQTVAAMWLAEAVLIAQLWTQSGLVKQLNEEVKVMRGRMGVYEVVDFTLLLLTYGVSQEATLSNFFKKLTPFKTALSALWERDKSPTPSALSRFLSTLGQEPVLKLRNLLFADLIKNGISLEHMGGLFDRKGVRHILFDIDATRSAARQRSLTHSSDYPQPKRRRANYAKGYNGRKRGELIRSRTTVQQAHTGEWLTTIGSAGNGDIWKELEQSCNLINKYMKAKSLDSNSAIVRLDGAYGWVRTAYICQKNQIGYLMRCRDYSLLDKLNIVEILKTLSPQPFLQVDSSKERLLYDCGFVVWNFVDKSKQLNFTLKTRLIVAVSDLASSMKKPEVGKLIGKQVYELFCTDRSSEQLTASDVVSLYFARGGFEQTLSQEDREQDPDRFCSQNQSGQEFWQLLAQWVWNARIRIGFVAQSPALRQTLWAEAISIDKGAIAPEIERNIEIEFKDINNGNGMEIEKDNFISSVEQTNSLKTDKAIESKKSALTQEEIDSGKIKMAQPPKEDLSKFSASQFILQPDGRLLCPANKYLRADYRSKESNFLRVVYQAKASDCKVCSLIKDCKLSHNRNRGRRVSLLLPLPQALPEPETARSQITQNSDESKSIKVIERAFGKEALYWFDLPSSSLRNFLPALLRSQLLEIKPPSKFDNEVGEGVVKSPILSRHQRAHRRLSWALRLKRNCSPPLSSPWSFFIYGLPDKVSAYLSNISSLAA